VQPITAEGKRSAGSHFGGNGRRVQGISRINQGFVKAFEEGAGIVWRVRARNRNQQFGVSGKTAGVPIIGEIEVRDHIRPRPKRAEQPDGLLFRQDSDSQQR
jgi:hypothetical protein